MKAPVLGRPTTRHESLAAVLGVWNQQIDLLSVVVGDHLGRHRDAEDLHQG